MNLLIRLKWRLYVILCASGILFPTIHSLYAQPAEPLQHGQSYTLELPNGSILRQAVFRSQRVNVYIFDVPGLGEGLALTEFTVLPEPKSRAWLISAGIGAAFPYNQQELGFSQSLAADLHFVTRLYSGQPLWVPQAALRGGFLRLDGERALLSGPELTAGAAWLVPLTKRANHSFYADLTTGAGFYRLLNEKVERTFEQYTFLLQSQIGYSFRQGDWGVLLAVMQSYIHDENRPLLTGGIRLAAVRYAGS